MKSDLRYMMNPHNYRPSKRLLGRIYPLPLFSFIALIALFSFALHLSDVFADAGNLPKAVRVGFSVRVFPDVDQRDAQVAMELWTKELARTMGVRTVPQTVIFKETSELVGAVNRGELHIVSLPATEYLLIRDKALMNPAIVAGSIDGNSRHFLLVVRRDSGIRSIGELKGSSILLPTITKSEASHIWLDVLLMREGKRDRTTFFRQIKEVEKASQAIMGVYFKQANAGIVSRGAFETGKGLNPQIGRQLMAIAESKSLLGDITCFPSFVDEKLKRIMENAALHLHETTTGRQMFTLFQIDRAIPFKPSYLEGLTELLKEREKLAAKLRSRR